jgi:hypothetical protein
MTTVRCSVRLRVLRMQSAFWSSVARSVTRLCHSRTARQKRKSTPSSAIRSTSNSKLAHTNFAAAGVAKRITVHEGEFAKVVKTLKGPYDVALFDGGTPVPAVHEILRKLLRPRGLLITANLNHGGTADNVLAALLDAKRWLTAFIDENRETGISIKL